jgi:hypothetical protein
MKKLLYTCLFGDTDDLKEPKKDMFGWDLVCYTNNKDLTSVNWDIEYVEGDSDKLLSRKYKILNNHPEYDITVYADATFQVKRNLDWFVGSKKSGIHLNRHPQRKCCYVEAEIVKSKGIDKKEIVDKQIERYRLEAFPENAGLWRCGIMVRNPKETQELSQAWWREIEQGSWRDQISFPYACWKSGVTPNRILSGITENYFQQSLHKQKLQENFDVIHFLDISNMKEVPKKDWIVVGNPGKDHRQLIKENPTTHLFVGDQVIIIPRWLHDYIPIEFNNKRRFDLQYKHYVEAYNGNVVEI